MSLSFAEARCRFKAFSASRRSFIEVNLFGLTARTEKLSALATRVDCSGVDRGAKACLGTINAAVCDSNRELTRIKVVKGVVVGLVLTSGFLVVSHGSGSSCSQCDVLRARFMELQFFVITQGVRGNNIQKEIYAGVN
jgi:hypothetical protein